MLAHNRVFENELPLPADKTAEICENSLSQSHNPAWLAERAGRLTVSNFKMILLCTKPEGLVKDILYMCKQVALKPSYPWLHGLDNEATAVGQYIALMGLYDKKIEIFETGLHVHERYPFTGASPDHLVRENNETGLLEVKYPASKAMQRVCDACAEKTFCAVLVDGDVTLKRQHAYFYHVQGQLGATRKPWCNFTIWTGHAELQHCLPVERIYIDENLWQEILEGLLYFYRSAVVPELITHHIRRPGFLYTPGAGYVPFQKYKQGFYVMKRDKEPLKLKLGKIV